jgi:hypothetical protein
MGFFDDIGQNLQGTLFAPSRNQRKPGILDRVLGLYGSDPNTHIPGGRNEALRKGLGAGADALMQAGMQGVPMSAFERANIALMGLQQGGPMIAQEKEQQRLKALLQSGNDSDLQLAFRQALSTGDNETAQLIGNHLSQRAREKQAGAASQARGMQVERMNPETGKYHNVLVNSVTGEEIADYGPVRPEAGVVVGGVDAEGNPVERLVNKRTGAPIAAYAQPDKPPSQYESEAASRLNQFSRGMVSDEVQGLLQAQNVIVTQIAKEIGGVRGAASPTFRNVIARTYLIAPGDSPTNIRQTLQSLRAMQGDLERKAGSVYEQWAEEDVDAMIQQDIDAGIYGTMPGFADDAGDIDSGVGGDEYENPLGWEPVELEGDYR